MPGAGMMPGGPGMGRRISRRGWSGADKQVPQILTQTVGELGDELQRRLREKIQSGDYGEILVQLGSAPTRPAEREAAAVFRGCPARAVCPAPAIRACRVLAACLQRYPGMPGAGGMPPGYARSARGAGAGAAGAGSAAAGARRTGWALPDGCRSRPGACAGRFRPPGMRHLGWVWVLAAARRPAQAAPASLWRGVTLLGKDSTKELLEKAADQGIDVLVVFEVEVKENPRPT